MINAISKHYDIQTRGYRSGVRTYPEDDKTADTTPTLNLRLAMTPMRSPMGRHPMNTLGSFSMPNFLRDEMSVSLSLTRVGIGTLANARGLRFGRILLK